MDGKNVQRLVNLIQKFKKNRGLDCWVLYFPKFVFFIGVFLMKVSKYIFLLVSFFSFNVYAELVIEPNVSVKRLGSHSGNTFYISLEKGFKRPCLNGLAYCSDTNESCKSMFAIALAAKTTGKSLPDFRYNYNEVSNACSVWLVSTE